MLPFLLPMQVVIPVFLSWAIAVKAEADPGYRYLHEASKEGVPPLNKKVYEELAKFSQGRFGIMQTYTDTSFPAFSPHMDTSDIPSPHDAMANLYNMGLDVLPVLTEALDDETPTKNYLYDPHTVRRTVVRAWKVNDLVGMLICAVAQRDFTIVQDGKRHTIRYIGSYTKLVPQFQKLVLDWYAENAKKSEAQRKIDDLEDEFMENREQAIRWIGYHKVKAGNEAILKNVDRIFDDKKNLPRSAIELEDSALALGKIGDPKSLKTIRRICMYISEATPENDMTISVYWPSGLFRAYYGLAILGKKDEALEDLEKVYKDYSGYWNPGTSKRFREKLDAIRSKKDVNETDWNW